MGQIGRRYAAAIERFAARTEIPIVRFRRGESKEELAHPYLEAAAREGRFGCVLIGVAQERARVWRGWRRGGSDAHPHFQFGRQSALPNHYFYVYDRDWGPAFWKCCAYARCPVWLCLDGQEWAKRQAEQVGLGFEALDNGFRATADATALATICARLSAREVWAFFRRWERLLPSPFSDEDRPGHRALRLPLPPRIARPRTPRAAADARLPTKVPKNRDRTRFGTQPRGC